MRNLSKSKGIKKAVKAPFSTAKNIILKVNPFNKNIDKNNVSDTGMESMRLAYTSVRKGKNAVKTVEKSIKTTHRTIKTTGTVVKKAGTAIYRTTAFTVKSAVAVSRFVGNAVIYAAASLMNPIAIFLAAIIIICMMMSLLVVMLLGGGVSASNSTKRAYSSAAGLTDVPLQYKTGVEYLNKALENHQNNFNSLIDSLYYSYDDLTYSNLVYMEKTNELGIKTIYEKSFADDNRKNALKSEWNIALTEREFLAIAYVYLENEKNTQNNTKYRVYKVSYTQEVFDTIVSKCAAYSDSIYNNQVCPDENCTRHVEVYPNPEYEKAVNETDKLWSAYTDWTYIAQMIYDNDGVNDDIQRRIDNWISTYNFSPYYSDYGWDFANDIYSWYSDSWDYMVTVPETIEEVTYICEHHHDLHSIGLVFFDKETVMNALNFDDISKQWVELTEKGFENNSDIL